MRVVKTLSKQLELAAVGRLFIIVNCTYVAVSTDHVMAAQNQGVKFYAKKP